MANTQRRLTETPTLSLLSFVTAAALSSPESAPEDCHASHTHTHTKVNTHTFIWMEKTVITFTSASPQSERSFIIGLHDIRKKTLTVQHLFSCYIKMTEIFFVNIILIFFTKSSSFTLLLFIILSVEWHLGPLLLWVHWPYLTLHVLQCDMCTWQRWWWIDKWPILYALLYHILILLILISSYKVFWMTICCIMKNHLFILGLLKKNRHFLDNSQHWCVEWRSFCSSITCRSNRDPLSSLMELKRFYEKVWRFEKQILPFHMIVFVLSAACLIKLSPLHRQWDTWDNVWGIIVRKWALEAEDRRTNKMPL